MSNPESSYMRLLPAVFYESGLEQKRSFIESYLRIFEKILSGLDDTELKGKKGLGELLYIIPELFHPRFSFLFERTNEKFLPSMGSQELETIKKYFGLKSWNEKESFDFLDEFLTWLASWMALVLKEDWELEKKREVIARIIPIYRMRGTKKGIEEFLQIYVGGNVEIFETMGTFQVGGSQVGIDTLIGGGMKPYFFTVKVTFPRIVAKKPGITEKEEQAKFIKNLKNVLDSEKPVHTSYLLKVSTPTLQIGNKEGSIIGRNTLIGGTFTEINA